MTLLEVIQNIGSFNEDDTICASRPWTIHSEAVVGPGPEDGSLSGFQQMYGKDYFLEVSSALDLVSDLMEAKGNNTTAESICNRVIRYADHDA